MKRISILLGLLLGITQNVFSQEENCSLLQKFSQEEIESLIEVNDNCNTYSVNTCENNLFILDNAFDPEKGVIYAKIKNKITAFYIKGKEYVLSYGGDPEGSFKLYFGQPPTEETIKKEMLRTQNKKVSVRRKRDEEGKEYFVLKPEKKIGELDEEYDMELESYFIYRSEHYKIHRFTYRIFGAGEAYTTVGEVFLYQKDGGYSYYGELESSFYYHSCAY